MSHSLLVLHFGSQCPWQPWVVEQARQAAEQLGGKVQVVDIAQQPDLAARYRLFLPFMAVLDGTIPLPSPSPANELVRIATEGLAMPPVTPTPPGREAQAEAVLPLTTDRVADTCHLCIRPEEFRGCRAKVAWAAGVTREVPDGILGFAAYHEGLAVSVVEFLPASLVPYALPDRTPHIAFITCIYSTEDGPDYRGQVLARLVRCLQATGYRELQVVAGQRIPYPNGPEVFFQRHGFEPVGEVDRVMLREGEEVLVLLMRNLRGAAD